MRRARRGWVMPEEDARSMLRLIEERIRSSDIRVEHRDVLIRLRAIIEEDLRDVERQLTTFQDKERQPATEPTAQSGSARRRPHSSG
jgi:hypothetical protein